MAEQSHKREMSDAVRGDFERLRKRGVVSRLTAPPSEDHDAAAPADEVEKGTPHQDRSRLSRLLRRD